MYDVEWDDRDLSGNGTNPGVWIAIRWSPKLRETASSRIGDQLHCPSKLIDWISCVFPDIYVVGTKLTWPRTSRLPRVVIYGWVQVWTAISWPLWKACMNWVGYQIMLLPIMKWVVVWFFEVKNWTRAVVGLSYWDESRSVSGRSKDNLLDRGHRQRR